ncbi:MAG: hypothetical protein ACK5NF_00495 [Bacilli bacterium]
MKNKLKYIIITIVAIVLVLFFVTRFTSKKEEKTVNKGIYTTLQDNDLTFYPYSKTESSLFFIVETNKTDISKYDIELTFDKEVSYDVIYEKADTRTSLPIEYYLAKETNFDFANIDDFNQYLSDRTMLDEYDVNDEYEKYLEDYKNNEDYKKYFKGKNCYVFEIKVFNGIDNTKLTNVKFVEHTVVNDEKVSNVVYEIDTDITYKNSYVSSSDLYDIDVPKYVNAKYYDNKIKYNYKMKCNQDLSLSNFNASGLHSIVINGINLNDSYSCSTNDLLNIELEFDVKNNKVFSNAIKVDFDINDNTNTIYTPHLFGIENLMLIREENLDEYDKYFEYKYYRN